MNIKNILIIFVLLSGIWMFLDGTFQWNNILIGAAISLLIAMTLCRNCNVYKELKLTPKAFLFTFIYLFVFLFEILRSNIDVAWRVLHPSLPINPGIVEVKTKLNSNMGKMLLANSISLTPGTLTVDIKDDRLLIHWIDVKAEDMEEATKKIVRKFEKYLEEIYG